MGLNRYPTPRLRLRPRLQPRLTPPVPLGLQLPSPTPRYGREKREQTDTHTDTPDTHFRIYICRDLKFES